MMAIRLGPTSGGPGPKYRAAPAPKAKQRDRHDIRVASHKQTVQHSVRAQKLGERQLSKFFKSLDDLKIKRLLQIDKEMSEQIRVSEKLANEREHASSRATGFPPGNISRSTGADSDLLPDHYKRGPFPSLRRGSNNFDFYAFMMRRGSGPVVLPYTNSTRVNRKSPGKSHTQVKTSPLPKTFSTPNKNDREEFVPVTECRSKDDYYVISPDTYETKSRPTSSISITSLTRSVSIESLPTSTCNDDEGVAATPTQKRSPSGTDWLRMRDVNKGAPRRARQRSKQLQNDRNRQHQRNKNGKEGGERRSDLIMNYDTANTTGYLKKEVSFHFDDEEDKGVPLASGNICAGIVEKNKLLKTPPATNQPECKEPDCIFHNKAHRHADHSDDEDYTIDDYYRTVAAKSTVSPLFMPTGSPRSWSRRGVVRPPSPNPSDFLREVDHEKTAASSPKDGPAEPNSFLSIRRPLKGSNREKMLKDKEENVRTTFNLMRKKMASQKPPEFNQNYGTPTPNWKILNPLKMRHKINQSNPLHARWGL